MSNSNEFYPVHKCNDGLFSTGSGITIDLRNPTPEMIRLEDIAHALAKICRFCGHVKKLYTVAQHSCLVASLVPPPLMQEALLHDAAEAYLGDVIKPLKVLLGKTYSDLERRFEAVIVEKFGLYHDPASKEIIKKYDLIALELEYEAFLKGNRFPLSEYIKKYRLAPAFSWAWEPTEASAKFIINYNLVKR